MINMALSAAAKAMQGELCGDDLMFNGVSTDTRQCDKGALFFALVGQHFDAHDLCETAFNSGAVAAVVERDIDPQGTFIKVDSTRAALGKLAKYWRSLHTVKVIGVTGSNGKTTVKEMLAAILCRRGEVLATRGNFNNDIGLPKTLFELGAHHQYAVLEMGANHSGEIAKLADISRPDAALITLCAPAHLEGFGSIEGVAAAKGEIYCSLEDSGVAIINADDRFHDFWEELVGSRRKIKFALQASNADVFATEITPLALGSGTTFILHCLGSSLPAKIPHDGTHNVLNALAASAGASALGCNLDDIVDGLANSAVVAGRLNIHQLDGNTQLIDDTYNANPTSLMAAVDVAMQNAGETWVVMGDMGELGDNALDLHRDCGQKMADAGVERLFTVGVLSAQAVQAFGPHGFSFTTKEELNSHILDMLEQRPPTDLTILVKGSRAAQMETVVQNLCEARKISC